ncbi:site-specific integrase [Pelagibacterium sp. 26DY04]|uniref:tyrosine-type recombinase/integrase n=1 Tax=Pelagibacterium sp. 26DY04 TaxID=2967130 RepID=UPI0028162A37|nr:site-specific integrase [Pelagibacterium sp. 26DY04]WMT88668.1 site-specific integrase [Pelagibacterium sp. 26DY04]
MAVKKRVWTTAKGEHREAWVVDYRDGNKKRRLKTFAKKRDADAFAASSKIQLKDGTHIPDRAGVTIAQAGELWIEAAQLAGREQTTIAQYRQHLDLHIKPLIGEMRITTLTIAQARQFSDDLRAKVSPAMVRKVMTSLGSLIGDAIERGLATNNVVRDLRTRRGAIDNRAAKRAKRQLRVGVDIPTRDEIKAILAHVPARYYAAIVMAAFTGMRASELRGLQWTAVNLNSNNVHIYQRADRFNNFGPPKSDAGERMIPLPPPAVDALKAWRKNCPKGDLNLVFPNLDGGVLSHTQLQRDGFETAQVAAGVTRPGKDRRGKAVALPKYTGLHALRHWFASWCINSVADGGRGLDAKRVQALLGHSSIKMTLDLYSHLFPAKDDHEELHRATAFFMESAPSDGDILETQT